MNYFELMHSKARRLDVDLFVRASPGMYLLGSTPIAGPQDPLRRSFNTLPTFTMAELEAAAVEQKQRDRTDGRFLCRVEKTDRNPWQGRITVGRAPNNDVIIGHPSVSKLHANILVADNDLFAPQPLQVLHIKDVGSRNGTRLNGTILSELSEVELRSGDRLMLGDVTCDLLSATNLHRIMRTQFPSA